ncbi:uncharacterized protein I303_102287 [Kwoniella dejecticola CBS 10117]|uniref:Uncharacterized protein n=1 Tax=Kwoniella dejecticola CBS 10117 TaxID=1296121 RepID=A0A1A6ABD7_9TREE|nr:uncharacterized protein I303_01573 [Kwoniella dejecticola CBS 10117]OBR87371.1 hypothetical protein I303_01573 [Kwoniella dejecticola CBS 10117]
MPKLGKNENLPVEIDRSPKFTPTGQRVFLYNQRRYTRWEAFLSVLTAPLLLWRFGKYMRSAMKSNNESEVDYLPDITVIVSTGPAIYDDLLDHVPAEIIEQRKADRAHRENITLKNRQAHEQATMLYSKSRSERLQEIDRRPKFTKEGERVLLMSQRQMTKMERLGLIITLPIFVIRAIFQFRDAQRRLKKEEGQGSWSWKKMNAYLDDPTLIIPTGPSYYANGELLNYDEVDKARFEDECMIRKAE